MSANFYKDNFQDESLMHNTMTMSGTQHFYCRYLTKVRTGILAKIIIILSIEVT